MQTTNKRKRINFRYKDALSKWEWREQSCLVYSVEQMIKIYGLDKDDVEYEIISIEEE